MRILILGTLSAGLLAVLRSLARHGATLAVAVPPGRAWPAALSLYCSRVVHVPGPDDPGLAPCLIDWLRRNPVDVVLPLADEWLPALADNAETLRQYAALAMAPCEGLAWALDKGRTVSGWSDDEHPLPPPLTVAAPDAESALEQWASGYPVIVKARRATGANGILVARDAAELARGWASVHCAYPQPLVQELIDYAPEDKYALLYLFDGEGRPVIRYMHRMIVERQTVRGVTGGRWPGGVSLIWQSAFDADLLARGEALLEGMGWRGFAEVECVRARSDGRARLMEVNARFPGTIGLALNQGVEFAFGACLVALGRRPVPQLDIRPGSRARQDWLTLLGARQWRPLIRALDPRVPGVNPPRVELALMRAEGWRLLGKRWRRVEAPSGPALPAA